jgi:hypothetical protein
LWAGRDSQLPTDPQQPPISQHPEHNPRAIDSKTL